VRQLPPDSQDEIARTILHLAASELEAEAVDPAHMPALLEGLRKQGDANSPRMMKSRPPSAASIGEFVAHQANLTCVTQTQLLYAPSRRLVWTTRST
jgi:hypothetical protein